MGFVFQLSPESLANVQMRRIGRQIKDEQSSPLPRLDSLPHWFAVMNPCVIQYYNRYLSDRKAKALKLFNDKLAADCLLAHRCPTLIASARPDAKQLMPLPFAVGIATASSRNCQPYGTFGSKLTPASCAVIQIYQSVPTHLLKAAQDLFLDLIDLLVRLAF